MKLIYKSSDDRIKVYRLEVNPSPCWLVEAPNEDTLCPTLDEAYREALQYLTTSRDILELKKALDKERI